jgi:hypothetical protein
MPVAGRDSIRVMTTMTRSYQVRAIDQRVAAALRDLDDAGRRPRLVTDHDGGSPLRCCLRPAQSHEPMLLASYAPLRRWARELAVDPGGYDEVGPVFIHPESCAGPADDGLPAELFVTRRMLRCYSDDGAIVGGRIVEPDEDAERVLEELLADPRVAVIHARAIEFGCFTFEVRRRVEITG